MKCNECGRSMIEMLGVLAIVGILSVGGIAGFSKAMAKYKFDRSLATYSLFIQDVMKYQKDWDRAYYKVFNTPNGQYWLRDLIVQAGLKPDRWQLNEDKCFTDEAGGRQCVDARGLNQIEFQYSFGPADNVKDNERNRRCVAIISEIIRPLDNLYTLTFWRGKVHFGDVLYGKSYCSENVVCLDDLSFGEIYDQCTACSKRNSSCAIVYVLK